MPYPVLSRTYPQGQLQNPSYAEVVQTNFDQRAYQYPYQSRPSQIVGEPAGVSQLMEAEFPQPMVERTAQAQQPIPTDTRLVVDHRRQRSYAEAAQAAIQGSWPWTGQNQAGSAPIYGVPSRSGHDEQQYRGALLQSGTSSRQPVSSSLSQRNVEQANQQQGFYRTETSVEGWVAEPRAAGERTGLIVSPRPHSYQFRAQTAMSPHGSIGGSSTLGNSRRSRHEIMSVTNDFMCTQCRAGFPTYEGLS